jgi:hypothetical protein
MSASPVTTARWISTTVRRVDSSPGFQSACGAFVIPALAALALVSAVCALVVAYEAIRHREHPVQVRHPEIVR